MELISVKNLIENYRGLRDKYIYIEGYYFDGYLYNSKNVELKERTMVRTNDYLNIDFYLKKLNQLKYKGKMRLVGKPGNKMYLENNITRIVKVELLNDKGDAVESIINQKIPLPKDLRGKL